MHSNKKAAPIGAASFFNANVKVDCVFSAAALVGQVILNPPCLIQAARYG
jgi:hypothetical protein